MTGSLTRADDSAQDVHALLHNHSQKGLDSGATAVQADATLASRQALISAADMAAVRSQLTADESARCPPQMVNQFLRATDSNVNQVGPHDGMSN